jgi:hypothetical protein
VNSRIRTTTAKHRSVIGTLIVLSVTHMIVSLPRVAAAADERRVERDILVNAATRIAPQQFKPYEQWSALQIMREAQRRHEQFPYVYEEQTMVLMDAQGHRSVRQCRRFSRTEDDGSSKFLLVFDHPKEIRGVVLLALRDASGKTERGVYLPAFGAEFKQPASDTRSGHFLGTDFSVEDLTIETLDEHNYDRDRDRVRENVAFFVIDAHPVSVQVERSSGYGLRKHWVRKDNFMIVQTDFFDRHLRFMKRITHHDLTQVTAQSWRANMIVVNDESEKHQTLLKINRRIYSRDYVPVEIFDRDFLLKNSRLRSLSDRITGRSQQERQLPPRDKPHSSNKISELSIGEIKGKTIAESTAQLRGER